jgi:hypothetical protein
MTPLTWTACAEFLTCCVEMLQVGVPGTLLDEGVELSAV